MGQTPGSLEMEEPKMGFGSAMEAVLEGKRVRRREWRDPNIHLMLVRERLMIYKTDDRKYHPLVLSAGDLAGEDWETVSEGTLH